MPHDPSAPGWGAAPGQPPAPGQMYAAPGHPPQPYGYQAVARGPVRPGAAVAIAVLQFIQAASVHTAGLVLLSAADMIGFVDEWAAGPGLEFTLIGVVTIVSGGLLIAGGVSVLSGRTRLTLLACGLSLVLSVYWLVRFLSWSGGTALGSAVGTVLSYSILPIICLALLPSVNRWAQQWRPTLRLIAPPDRPVTGPAPRTVVRVGRRVALARSPRRYGRMGGRYRTVPPVEVQEIDPMPPSEFHAQDWAPYQSLSDAVRAAIRDADAALEGLSGVLDFSDVHAFTCELVPTVQPWGTSLWQEVAVTDGRRLVLWHGDDEYDEESELPWFTSSVRTIPLSAIVDQGLRLRYRRTQSGPTMHSVMLYLSTQTPERQVTELGDAAETRTTQYVETYRFSKSVTDGGLAQMQRLLQFGRAISRCTGTTRFSGTIR